MFKVDYGHAEVLSKFGKDPREYCVVSKAFVKNAKNQLIGINTVRVEWSKSDDGKWSMQELPGTEEYFKADLVLLSMVNKIKKYDDNTSLFKKDGWFMIGILGTYQRID